MRSARSEGPKRRRLWHPGLPDPKVLDLVDLFLFVADARIPATSIRLASPYLGKKRRVYVLVKPDLADPGATALWLESLSCEGIPAFAVDCRTAEGLSSLVRHLRLRKQELDARTPSGLTPRPIRLMLFGLPNAGKSSLANRLLGSARARFGAKPGLTRGSQWLRGRGFLEVLDTPGVVDTSQVKGEAKMKLASVWALPDGQFDPEEVALWLARKVLCGAGPSEARDVEPLSTQATESRTDMDAALSYIEEFGRRRGLIGAAGAVDLERASRALVHAFREGELGRFTLELPSEIPKRVPANGQGIEGPVPCQGLL